MNKTKLKVNGTLTRHIALSLIGVVIVLSVFSIGTTYFYLSHLSRVSFNEKAEEYVDLLRDSLEIPIWKLDNHAIEKICNVFSNDEHFGFMKVTSDNGVILFEHGDATRPGLLEKTFHISHKKTALATIDLQLNSVVQNDEYKKVLLSSLFLVLVVALGLMVSTKILLQKLLQRPLEYLISRIKHISDGDYSENSEVFPQNEFADIAEEFNVMANRVKLRETSLAEMNKELMNQINEKNASEKAKVDLEAQLRQAYKMEAIGTLAGGIAHDFNNILGVILGYTEMAREDAPPGSPIIQDLDKVLAASNRAKELVAQILTFSRQTNIDLSPITIQPIIKESLKMLRSSIPTTIEIKEDIDPLCKSVLADPTQIHQIIMNLSTNAYHSMDAKGGVLSVQLRSSSIESIAQQDSREIEAGEYVELIVSDTGSGIGPDVIGKIFSPYFTTKGVGKGTGMGLSIIHGIVKACGGAVTVESLLGKGTTFHVFLPVTSPESIKEANPLEFIVKGDGRILFVDDEELLVEMGKDMLERMGYEVTARTSSLEALEVFQNSPDSFDVVLTDQTMPGMTGADLARRILQIRPEIPIILCTGYSNLIDEDIAKSIGIREFALKPLVKSSISKLINKVLGNKELPVG